MLAPRACLLWGEALGGSNVQKFYYARVVKLWYSQEGTIFECVFLFMVQLSGKGVIFAVALYAQCDVCFTHLPRPVLQWVCVVHSDVARLGPFLSIPGFSCLVFNTWEKVTYSPNALARARYNLKVPISATIS